MWIWTSDLTSWCSRQEIWPLVHRVGSDYQPHSWHRCMDSKWTNTFQALIPWCQAHCKRLVNGGCCHGYYSPKFFIVADKDAPGRHRAACLMGFWPSYQRNPSCRRLKRKRQICIRKIPEAYYWMKKSEPAEKCILHDTIYVGKKNPNPTHQTTLQFLTRTYVCVKVHRKRSGKIETNVSRCLYYLQGGEASIRGDNQTSFGLSWDVLTFLQGKYICVFVFIK